MTAKKTKLPSRVHFKHGAYYFVKPVFDGVKSTRQWVRMGKTEQEMYAFLAELNETRTTMEGVFDRYKSEILPKKAGNTQKAQIAQMARLELTFGKMSPRKIRPAHIAQYHDAIGKTAPYQANRELALITHILKCAVRWGFIDENPAREVQRFPEEARERYVTHEEFEAVKAVAPDWLRLLMQLGYITGQRRADLLSLTTAQIQPDGIHIEQSKTKKRLILEWTPALKAAVDDAKATLEGWKNSTPKYLICDASGQARKDAAFTTAWTRLMANCIKNNIISEPFQYRDIRAKAGSDSDGKHLGHKNTGILQKHYKRLPEKVKPTL